MLFLLLSAFFSGSEVALFSIDKKTLRELKLKSSLLSKYIVDLLENQRKLLVTILLGNTVFNVGSSIIAVSIAVDLANQFSISLDLLLLLQVVVLTILVLIFGEIVPKVWASKSPLKFSYIVSFPLYWATVLVYPVSKILTDSLKVLVSIIKLDNNKTAIHTSEIKDLAELGVERGTIEEEEQELIHGLVSFKSITVREIMTPRVDITSVSKDTSFSELMEIITESGHSRIPLYDEQLDNIIGIIYAKDLLPFIGDNKESQKMDLHSISRKAYFVPETKLISDLMHEFQEKNIHLGIVVDEYGGTSGLVSLEDILEEIVGEIRDEYDKEENEIVKLNDSSYMVLGKVPIDEINELLEDDFSSDNDDYDTVGGLLFNLSGTIPEVEYSVEYSGYRFTVKEIDNKRINKILIEKSGKP